MNIQVFPDKQALADAAAAHAAGLIEAALIARQRARILVATAASQIEFLDALRRRPGIAWQRVEVFHLDEYVGLPLDHPASFRRFLLDRFIRPLGIPDYHLLDGEDDPDGSCREVGRKLAGFPPDVAFAGIGENGHLAFNDPPADFEATEPYRVVRLDERCRSQQVGEGWFKTLADVPERAMSISIRQLLRSKTILSIVPDMRKAEAVRRCLKGPVTPFAPASVLQTHSDVTVYLDRPSASLLDPDAAAPGDG